MVKVVRPRKLIESRLNRSLGFDAVKNYAPETARAKKHGVASKVAEIAVEDAACTTLIAVSGETASRRPAGYAASETSKGKALDALRTAGPTEITTSPSRTETTGPSRATAGVDGAA